MFEPSTAITTRRCCVSSLWGRGESHSIFHCSCNLWHTGRCTIAIVIEALCILAAAAGSRDWLGCAAPKIRREKPMVAEVTGNPPKSVNQWSEMPKISPTPVQGGSGVDVAPKPTPGLAFGQGAALAQASPATRPKTVSPLQLTEINKARDHLKAAQTPDEVTAAKEELRRAVDNEMYRLSSHSRIYVVRSPTDRRDVGKRIVDQFAGDQDVREAIRGA